MIFLEFFQSFLLIVLCIIIAKLLTYIVNDLIESDSKVEFFLLTTQLCFFSE